MEQLQWWDENKECWIDATVLMQTDRRQIAGTAHLDSQGVSFCIDDSLNTLDRYQEVVGYFSDHFDGGKAIRFRRKPAKKYQLRLSKEWERSIYQSKEEAEYASKHYARAMVVEVEE